MSVEERERYMHFFNEADMDKDGQLSLAELTAALRHRGYNDDLKIKAMFDSVDDSGDRLISPDEYLKAMGQLPDKDHKIAAMHRVFRQYDKNGDGEIDKSELEAVFKELGRIVPKEQIDRIMTAADQDGNQKMNYEEFMKHFFL